jgi:TRAP-type C4-dicarboxylate transport system permease small subunit
MVGLIFLPLAYVQRSGGHIIVEIFTQTLARKLRLLLDAGIGMFMAVYTAVFVWFTAVEAVRKTVEREFLEATNTFIVIWPVRWLLPIGFGVMGLIAIYQTYLSLRALRTGGEPVTGRGAMD